MKKRELVPSGSADADEAIPVATLPLYMQDWLSDCEMRQHSPQTIEVRRIFLEKFLWFLKQHKYESCSTREIRDFFRYLAQGHNNSEGRWGNPRNNRPLRPISIKDYHVCLKGWFNWLVQDGLIDSSPMGKVTAPVARPDQKEPLNPEKVEKLLAAARRSAQPKRDEAILSLLLDTGIRASELCGLTMHDLNMENRSLRVRGKGNKYRECYIGRSTSKTLSKYLRGQQRASDEPVFVSDRGHSSGDALTRSGLLQLLRRLSHSAGIYPLVSVHQMRRTFAVSILRNGANLPTVQRLMGHTSITMTARYLQLAQADIEAQHRAYSPRDFLKGHN